MKTIIHHVAIKAPATEVHDAIVSPEGLANWWTTDVSQDADVLKLHFMEGMGPHMKIVKNDKSQVTWRCIGGHDNWQDNTFTFDLNHEEGMTHLMFRQHYTVEMPDEVYGTYNYNWGYYLDSLRQYCEEGTGKPFEA
jgi:uncharacterized protein YndB with AHSA1/START domain